jgi:hypothetical protein
MISLSYLRISGAYLFSETIFSFKETAQPALAADVARRGEK